MCADPVEGGVLISLSNQSNKGCNQEAVPGPDGIGIGNARRETIRAGGVTHPGSLHFSRRGGKVRLESKGRARAKPVLICALVMLLMRCDG